MHEDLDDPILAVIASAMQATGLNAAIPPHDGGGNRLLESLDVWNPDDDEVGAWLCRFDDEVRLDLYWQDGRSTRHFVRMCDPDFMDQINAHLQPLRD